MPPPRSFSPCRRNFNWLFRTRHPEVIALSIDRAGETQVDGGLTGPTGGHHHDTLARPESQRRTMKLITMVDAATVLTTARVPITPPRPPRAPAARPSQTKPATHKTAPATSKVRNRG